MSPRLPKIVLARMLGQSGSVAGEHLDPNLLAAFAEHSLLERERSAVLIHLAECAVCRESLALAFPSGAAPQLPEDAASDRWASSRRSAPAGPTSRWTWRWIAPAALLACAMATVAIYYRAWRGGQRTTSPAPASLTSKATNPPAAEGRREAPTAEPKVAESIVAPTVVSARPEAKKAESGREQAQVRLKQELALSQAGARATVVQSEQVAAVIPKSQRSDHRSADSFMALANAPPESTPALEGMQVPRAGVAGSTALQPAAPMPAPSAPNQTVEVSPSARFKAVPSAREPSAAARSLGPLKAAVVNRAVSAAPLAPAALWSIESWRDPSGKLVGRVQRSFDGGGTWQQVTVSDAVDFRAVAAIGSEVWAGGSHGFLFHSSDGGERWVPVSVRSSDQTLSGTITSIDAPDATHLTVATDSGEKWITSDAGQHWTEATE